MASKTLLRAADTGANRAAAVQAAAQPFFSLSAEYLIAPTASAKELANDFECLIDCAEAIFAATHESLTQEAWGALYLMRQAHAVFRAYRRMLVEQGETP